MTVQLENQSFIEKAKEKEKEYKKAATLHQIAYFTSEITAVVLLLFTPILALTQKPIWAAISSSSGLIAALSTKYGWQKNWIECQETSKAIEQKITFFELQNSSQNNNKNLIDFVEGIYKVESKHMEDWVKIISLENPTVDQEINNQNAQITPPPLPEDEQ